MTYDQIIRFGNRVKPKLRTEAYSQAKEIPDHRLLESLSSFASVVNSHQRAMFQPLADDATTKKELRALWYFSALVDILTMRFVHQASRIELLLAADNAARLATYHR